MSAVATRRHVYRATSGAQAPMRRSYRPDSIFVITVMLLVAIGLLMLGSASLAIAERQMEQPFYYLQRQMIYILLGGLTVLVVRRLPLQFWQRISGLLLLFGVLMLVLVLIPGVGREVNGSARWIGLGMANIQPSELVKLAVIIYLAGYLVRRGSEISSEDTRTAILGFVKPMVLLAMLCVLLLAEPDFGAATIMMGAVMAMLFLGGVRLWQFGVLLVVVAMALALLAVSSPYRLERITAFMNPWADPFASGFQLTQALIAFGRGEWLGVGLGNSVQKLFYLPEAHTDFLFAVMAEELGLLGSLLVIGLFACLVWRAFIIARRAERVGAAFAAYMTYGLTVWIALQALTNIGVNMGLLPTKGLTLPLMSYGGSSLLVMFIVVGLILRVDYETGQARSSATRIRRKR